MASSSLMSMGNEDVVRVYVGVFMNKMLAELNSGDKKPVEHVFRNLVSFSSVIENQQQTHFMIQYCTFRNPFKIFVFKKKHTHLLYLLSLL